MRAAGLSAAAWMLVLAGTAWGQAPASQPTVPAEAQKQPDPYEGRVIRAVVIRRPLADKPGEYAPVSAATAQLARNQIRSLEGREFRRDRADEDLARLTRLGLFKTIRSEVQLNGDGSVTVYVTVTERALVQDVQVVGNRQLTDQDLLAVLDVIPGTPVDRLQIDRGARAIEGAYRTKGFYGVRVEADSKELDESAIVLYRVVEGERVKVMGVRFDGNRTFTNRELSRQIKTTVAIPVLERGPLDDDVRKSDESAITQFYRDRGYLDARVSSRVQPSPNGKEAIVTFLIDEGPRYTLRSVRVWFTTPEALDQYARRAPASPSPGVTTPGARPAYLTPEQMREIGRSPLSAEQVMGIMSIKPGDVYSDDKVRRSVRLVQEAYSKLGHIRELGIQGVVPAGVEAKEVRDEARPEVDLILLIDEGKPAVVGTITVNGNEQTRASVVLREMRVAPERPLDMTALSESVRRIENTRLFAPQTTRATVQREDPARPGVRDIAVEVAETNTGTFSFGAVVDSDGGLVGQIGLRERNFDVLDLPDSFGEFFSGRSFRGGGQTATLDLQPGVSRQTYTVSLAEPYLLDTDYTGSVSFTYRTERLREYDEQRYGPRIGLGRRFGTIWDGVVAARYESVKLSDIEPDAPTDYFDFAKRSSVAGLGIELRRTTIPPAERFRPTYGSRLELGAEQVGLLGGDFEFTKLKLEYKTFFPVYESFLGYKTVVTLENRIAYIPQDKDEVPIYERYSMGGNSFRGFARRTIAPRGIRNDTGGVSDDPAFGTWSFFLGAEINQPVYQDIVSVVGFIDTGTVLDDPSLKDYRVAVGFGFRIYVRQLSPAPLAFDFGFPIVKEDRDRRRLFTFSIDLPYN
ncbi:MAG: BamA/TamA family outer membrane protein [Phycisphaerae bacterium]|nr:BamA/TamA family outer membrane protein [Phycisphaerae bacterium]